MLDRRLSIICSAIRCVVVGLLLTGTAAGQEPPRPASGSGADAHDATSPVQGAPASSSTTTTRPDEAAAWTTLLAPSLDAIEIVDPLTSQVIDRVKLQRQALWLEHLGDWVYIAHAGAVTIVHLPSRRTQLLGIAALGTPRSWSFDLSHQLWTLRPQSGPPIVYDITARSLPRLLSPSTEDADWVPLNPSPSENSQATSPLPVIHPSPASKDRIRGLRLTGDSWGGLFLTGGGAVALNLALEYRFAIPLKLAVELGPGLLVTGLSTNHVLPERNVGSIPTAPYYSGSARGVLGLALRLFELSVGGGGAGTTNQGGSAAQLSLAVRIGRLDGFNASAHGAIWLPNGNVPWQFDNVSLSFNIPMIPRLGLAVTGTIGSGDAQGTRWGVAGVDVRGYLAGMGGPGTAILQGGIGFFLVDLKYPLVLESLGVNGIALGGFGPAIHLGFDTRF